MTRKFTFTILAMLFAILGPGAKAWGQNYQLVTSTSDLVAGCKYLIGNSTSGEDVKFMSTVSNANNRKVTSGTVSNDGIVSLTNEMLVLELGGSTGEWTLKTTNYLGTNGYLASAASGSNNYCRVIADKTTATISFSDNAAVITIQPHTSRNILRYNSSASCFACYSSGQNAVYLYKESTSSTEPTCTIDPTSHDFGEIAVGGNATFDFTVTTANLTEDLTLAVSEGFSVSPATIESTETETTVTVTCAPTAVGALDGTLTISGGGLTDDVTATLSATGIGTKQYTITYSAANGTAPEAQQVTQGSSVTLSTINDVDCNTWQFAGWSESENSTEAPALMAGDEYTPEDDVTLYAVYKKQTGSETADYTLQYDTWTYSGTTTNKSSYRLFGNSAYIESAESHDLSNVTAVKITMRTFGGTGYKNVNIEDASGNVWGNAAATGSTLAEITATKTNGLTGNGKLRIKSKSGNGTDNGVGISKVVHTVNNTSYTYSTDPDCSTPVATPTITPNGGEFIGSQEITLACTTEGATISYTFDNWETSNIYSTPFTITETTTIKAKANKDGMSESEVATATFTKIPVLETMQEIFDASATAGNYYVKFNNYVVSGVTSSNAYITDGENGFIVYKSSHGFAVGDILNGTAQLALKRYNGAAEFTNLTSTTEGISVTTGGTITPTEVSIADLSGVNTGAVIKVNNVQYNGTNLVDENSNIIKPYNAVDYNPTFTNGLKYNVTGVYIQFNTTKEIAPRSANDIVLIVEAPTFNPEGGDYNAAQTVEITSATTGATIYYTLDKSNPTTGSTPYTDPIEISENTTIKAIAVKNGVSSEIATAVYTITITTVATPTFEPEGGSYFNESLEVSLDCATDGATIVYTTNDWSTQNNYTAPFTITETTTVKAKATKANMDDSEIAEATYTKRYKVDYVVNGNGSLFEPTYVTPSSAIGTLPTPEAEYIPTGFDFAGWSDLESSTTTIGETYIVDADVTLYAVFSREEGGTPGSGNYEKVTAQLTDWRGDYLIAYSDEVFMDGSLAGGTNGVGKAQTHVSPESALSGNTISAAWGDEHHVTIEAIDDTDLTKGYVIKSHSKTTPYFYQTSNSNGMAGTENKSTAATYPITITLNTENDVRIALGGKATGAVLRYNNTSGSTGEMFRYYKNCGQQPIYLYKKDAGAPGTTHYYTRVFLNETAEANITISGPSIIPAGSTLNMGTYTLANATAANLIIEDGGQLIHHNAGVAATVKKSINGYTGYNDNYYLIANPTDNTTVANLTSNNYDLYTFNPAGDGNGNEWINMKNLSMDVENGIGYLYANDTKTTLEFAGNLTPAGSSNIELTYANAGEGFDFPGFNLIGNPFACNAYPTDGNGNFMPFYKTNETGSELTLVKNVEAIAPCEGFFVEAEEDGQTVVITTEESEVESSALSLTVSQNRGSVIDRAIVSFNGSANLHKFMLNPSHTNLSIAKDGETFAAVSSETKGELPVSFKAETTGTYTISVNTENVTAGYIHLIDNMTGTDVDLLATPSYTFIGSPRDNENRFTVKFEVSYGQDGDGDEHFAYQNGSELVINGEGTLQIFDVLGRVVVSEEVHGQTVNVGGLNTGAYIVRLTGESVKTQKIVVR